MSEIVVKAATTFRVASFYLFLGLAFAGTAPAAPGGCGGEVRAGALTHHVVQAREAQCFEFYLPEAGFLTLEVNVPDPDTNPLQCSSLDLPEGTLPPDCSVTLFTARCAVRDLCRRSLADDHGDTLRCATAMRPGREVARGGTVVLLRHSLTPSAGIQGSTTDLLIRAAARRRA